MTIRSVLPSSRTWRKFAFGLVGGLGLCWANGPAEAQVLRWETTGDAVLVDFTAAKPAPRMRFLPDGAAREIPLEFAMIRESVAVTIKHPQAGRAELSVHTPDAQVKFDIESADKRETKVRVTAKLPVMSRDDNRARAKELVQPLLAKPRESAQAEAKNKRPGELSRYLRQSGLAVPPDPADLPDAFIEARAVELAKDQILDALKAFATEKPTWVTEKEQSDWHAASPVQRIEAYFRLLQLRIAEQHLDRCGFKLDATSRNVDALVWTKFDALHALMTDTSGADERSQRAVRALTREELAQIKQALTISLGCRFYPESHQDDANSEWYNGQQVHCVVRGASAVRVYGELNQARNDSVDWWTLRGYDESTIVLRWIHGESVSHELFPDGPQQVRLQVSAKVPGNASYAFELSLREEPAGESVEIHETPAMAHAKFPY